MNLTAEYVRSILDYDPETGEFRWKHRANVPKRINKRYVGKIAGTSIYPYGRRKIVIDDKPYRSSRLAWLMQTGVWPSYEIDHKDNDPSNDRWDNLRPATRGSATPKPSRHEQQHDRPRRVPGVGFQVTGKIS